MLPPAQASRLKEQLDQLVRSSDAAARREQDPVGLVHRYRDNDDREVAGLIAATLAFGNVAAIRASVERVLLALGPSPAAAVDQADRAELGRCLEGWAHRVWTGPDVAAMLAGAARVRREHGSLGAALATELQRTADLKESLARLADRLRGPDAGRSLRHLVSDPRKGSACKRLLLYLRWMIRPADGVDLGLWPLPPSVLLIPLDTHVHRIAQNLGLTARRDASWRTAEEVTAALRRLDARDPVRYDFALCHLGVSRECPSRRDPQRCDRCVLRTVCLQWLNG